MSTLFFIISVSPVTILSKLLVLVFVLVFVFAVFPD